MKNSKLRKALLLAACAVLLVCLSVGATLAYLADNTEVATNTFTVGSVRLDIWETDTDNDENTADNGKDDYAGKDKANAYKVYPGQPYVKDPTLYVEKGSENCYVAAKIVVSVGENGDFAQLKDLLDYTEESDGTTLLGFGGIVTGGVFNDADLEYKGNGVWESADHKLIQVLGATNSTFYVVWKNEQTISEDADAPFELFNTITIPDDWKNEDIAKMQDMKIDIVGYAVQADGFRAVDGKDVEDALVAAFPDVFDTVLGN